MIIIILAAGKGSRMKSELPKVLHPIHDISMIKRVVNLAHEINSDRIIVVVGYKGHLVKKELENYVIEFVEQSEQLGTGHAVLQCQKLLENYRGDIIVLSGDTPFIKKNTLLSLISNYKSHTECQVGILTTLLDNPYGYGRIIREDGGIRIVEERDVNESERLVKEVNSGIYIFDSEALFRGLPLLGNDNSQKEYYLTDVVKMLKAPIGQVVDDPNEVMGINSKEQLKVAEEVWRE